MNNDERFIVHSKELNEKFYQLPIGTILLLKDNIEKWIIIQNGNMYVGAVLLNNNIDFQKTIKFEQKHIKKILFIGENILDFKIPKLK